MSRESTSLKKFKRRLLKTGKAKIEHFESNDAISEYCIFSGSTEALVRCGGKL